jgi:hypothetical protein
MFLLYMAHAVDMGVGQPSTLDTRAIWYYYANSRVVQ